MNYSLKTSDNGFSYLEKTLENGEVTVIPIDEANADYQAYLAEQEK